MFRNILAGIMVMLSVGVAKAQTNVTAVAIQGKWKPVYATIDKYIIVDVKADKITLADTLNEIVKADENPEDSKKMFSFIADMMLNKMKTMEEAYTADAVYTETNTKTGHTKNGKYSLDEKLGILTREMGARKDIFTVSFTEGKLQFIGELGSGGGKKGELLMLFEKQ